MAEDNDRTAESHAETYHRHGDPDPSNWDEAKAVTGRPADKPGDNTTFAGRAKAAGKASNASKQVDGSATEDKSVSSAATKRARKR